LYDAAQRWEKEGKSQRPSARVEARVEMVIAARLAAARVGGGEVCPVEQRYTNDGIQRIDGWRGGICVRHIVVGIETEDVSNSRVDGVLLSCYGTRTGWAGDGLDFSSCPREQKFRGADGSRRGFCIRRPGRPEKPGITCRHRVSACAANASFWGSFRFLVCPESFYYLLLLLCIILYRVCST
jgi:hypothetical protein